jgi:hypothetical protein
MVIEMSQDISAMAAALAKAQSEIKPAVFDASNPHFKSKYATLASVIEAAKPLQKNGISFSQLPTTDISNNVILVGVTTMLMHESGQWIRSTFSIPLPVEKAGAQQIGSALTYARRYSLASAIGCASDEDDDANSAQAAGKQLPKKQEPKREQDPQPKKTVVAQPPSQNYLGDAIKKIFSLCSALGYSPEKSKSEIGAIMGLGRAIKSSEEITDLATANRIVGELEEFLHLDSKNLKDLFVTRKEGSDDKQ